MGWRTCEPLASSLDCTVSHIVGKCVQPMCDCMCVSFGDDDGNYHFRTFLRNVHLFCSDRKFKEKEGQVRLDEVRIEYCKFYWILQRFARFLKIEMKFFFQTNLQQNRKFGQDHSLNIGKMYGWLTTAQCPVVAFSFRATFAGHFHKTFVQTEIVANRILPAFFVLFKIWKVWHDIRVDLI